MGGGWEGGEAAAGVEVVGARRWCAERTCMHARSEKGVHSQLLACCSSGPIMMGGAGKGAGHNGERGRKEQEGK